MANWFRNSITAGLAGALVCLLYYFAAGTSSTDAYTRPDDATEALKGAAGRCIAGGTINLGTVAAGGRAETYLRLRNPFGATLRIAKIETSCPCMSVRLSGQEVAPGKEVSAFVCLDLADEPDFTGWLCPEIRFFGPGGRLLLARRLVADVVGHATFGQPTFNFAKR